MNEHPIIHFFYFAGIKHSGKSQLGRGAAALLSSQADASFIDIDTLILKQISPIFSSIRDFYRTEGKARFMSVEFKVLEDFLKSVALLPPNRCDRYQIVATGGGSCDNLPLLNLMHDTGTIIYLQVEETALFKRILADGIPPFLEGPDPREIFHRLYDERNEKYSKIADFVIQLSDSNTIEENSAILAERLLQFVS